MTAGLIPTSPITPTFVTYNTGGTTSGTGWWSHEHPGVGVGTPVTAIAGLVAVDEDTVRYGDPLVQTRKGWRRWHLSKRAAAPA